MDLLQVLKVFEEGFKFSKEVFVDDFFFFDVFKRVEDIRNRMKNKNYIEEVLKKFWNVFIGNFLVGRDFFVRIFVEVVDVFMFGVEKIVERVFYYFCEGVDIIDIGMVVGERNFEFVDVIFEI